MNAEALDFPQLIDLAIAALTEAKNEASHGATANGEWIARCLSIAMTRSARAMKVLEANGRA